MATTQEHATFSAHVYGGVNAPALPSGWVQVDTRSSQSGLYAEAYRNTATGEIAIAYRGTEPTDGGDLRADYAIATQKASEQFNEAWRFARDIVTSNPNAPVSATGHSLGGALAQYVSGVFKIPGETFNAPGIKNMSGLLPMTGNNVTNWVVPTDIVGNFGEHVGTKKYLPALPVSIENFLMVVYGPAGLPISLGFYLFRSHKMENIHNQFATATTIPSPILLDLDGDGVETTAVGTGAYFDHGSDGFAEQTGWVSPDDGLLVRDLDGNGLIDTGSETLLADGTKASNGFTALAELDGNSDGKINGTDSVFATLKIWKYINSDGYSSSGELLSLADAGVQSTNVTYTASTVIDAHGNAHRQATDVWFQTDPTYSMPTAWANVPTDSALLPDAQGYGKVRELQQAAASSTRAGGRYRIEYAGFGNAANDDEWRMVA